MTLALLARAFQAIVAILAVMAARRTPEHKPIAVFFCGMTLADTIQWALEAWMLPAPAMDAPSLVGLARVAGHVGSALFLTGPMGLAAMALAVFLRRRPWIVFAAWAAVVVGLAVMYPLTRGVVLQRCYLAVELAAVAVTAGAFVQWVWKREPVRLHHATVSLVLATEVTALVAGPWRSLIFSTWVSSQLMYAVLFAVLIAFHGGVLWISPSSSSQ